MKKTNLYLLRKGSNTQKISREQAKKYAFEMIPTARVQSDGSF